MFYILTEKEIGREKKINRYVSLTHNTVFISLGKIT